jgi:hypothetical protein
MSLVGKDVSMQPDFDLSLLPQDPLLSFVVVADTHYMLDPGEGPLEFESRRHQSRRAAAAWRQVAALSPDFVVHLGDLVQEYPETPDFDRALDGAMEQLRGYCPFPVYHVAGNHDVGDKPDPTMPTHPVTAEGLAAYHRRFGSSWYSFDRGPLHGIVVNSQILNSDLEAADEQRRWLEADLAAHSGRRLAVFTHLPPYLSHHSEAGLGNYDIIDQPDRTWLLDLVRRYEAEVFFAGHVHFAFADQAGPTRYRLTPSTSFTRPGFSHLFCAAPPPERGRDDWPKLGFYWCRVFAERLDLHFIRTSMARGEDVWPSGRRVVTPAPAPNSRGCGCLGLGLSHPLAETGQVPIAFPSLVRQPVRNDYPLLSLLELGAAVVRFPWTDLVDPHQRRRLEILRDEGVALQATLLWDGRQDLIDTEKEYGDQVDYWEVQLPGGPSPSGALLERLADFSGRARLGLAAVVAGERIGGKQHPRARVGFRAGELAGLAERVQCSGVKLDFTLCRFDADVEPMAALAAAPADIGRLDCLLPLEASPGLSPLAALFAVQILPAARLFLEPFITLDRTMDAQSGLLDSWCNPGPSFHMLRVLHAVIQACKESGLLPDNRLVLKRQHRADIEALTLETREAGTGFYLRLLLPTGSKEKTRQVPTDWIEGMEKCYDLTTATVSSRVEAARFLQGPLLLQGCS